MKHMLQRGVHYRNRAFSLVELLIVVLILGALAFIAVPRISQSSTQAKLNACEFNRDLLQRQLELYFHDTGTWPSGYWVFSSNKDYFPDGPPKCPYGVPYKINKTHHRIRLDHDCLSGE